MMKKKTESDLIIRKKSLILTMLRRGFFLVILWGITGYIIYINVCFLLNAYSDTLVSDYLLLNLSYYSYARFALLVVVVTILMTLFGWLRIRSLERRVKNHEQDKS